MSLAKEIAKQELQQEELREFRGNNYKAIFDCRDPQVLNCGPAGTGKEQPLSAVVWTPEGPKTMGDMKIGDVVCSPTCGSATVIAVHPQGTKDVYRVTFNTGEEVECGRDHLWTIEWIGGGKRGGKKRRVMRTTAPLHEIEKRYLIGKRKRPQFWIPNGIAQFNHQEIGIDPYLVGILIGDGSLSRGGMQFTTADPFIVSEIQSIVGDKYSVKKLASKYGYSITAKGWRPGHPLRSKGGTKYFSYGKWRVQLRTPNNGVTYGGSFSRSEDADEVIAQNKLVCFSDDEISKSKNCGMLGYLRKYGLWGTKSENKFVPNIYKYNSESVRLAVIQGLMDTDGTVDRVTGMPSFTSVSKRLAEDVAWLIRSLGGACRITTKQPPNGQLAYTCWIRFNENKSIFRLPRKKDLAKNRTKYPVRKFIEKIELVRQDECKCITIDSKDGLYFTDHFVVTHNSVALITKLHLLCLHMPNIRCLMARKTRHSLAEAAIVSFEKLINVGQLHVDFGTIQRGHRPLYKYPNGSEIILGGMDDPSKVMSTEYDCLIGETEVESPSEIERAYSRPYSGKIITITTARGYRLTGTPNHPILTDHGWRSLHSISKGDYVISRRFIENKVSGTDPDVANKPATIADVARSLSESRLSRTERVETVPMDFHGDVTHSYVDVVTTAGLFHDRRNSTLFDPISQFDGAGRNFEQTVLVGNGSTIQRRFRTRRKSLPSAGLPQLPHSLAIGFGLSPSLDSSLSSYGEILFPDWIDSHSGLPVGQSLGGSFPSDAAFGHFLFQPIDADMNRFGDVREPRLLGDVALDCVVDVQVTNDGSCRHVYNLQTKTGWYFANSIVSHNCAYVQEATELTEHDWDAISSRLRNGRLPYQQLIADCNPSYPQHWLKKRCDAGQILMLPTFHKDNPAFYERDGVGTGPDGQPFIIPGKLTKRGRDYMKRLDALTGPRRLRLRDGKWVQAEGVVYEEWDDSVNVIDRRPIPRDWVRYISIDFGFQDPMVIQWWASDSDRRLYLYREIVQTMTLVEDLSKEIINFIRQDKVHPAKIICDHDAEGRATLEKHLGRITTPAAKDIAGGIQSVAARIRKQEDGFPRLMVMRDSLVRRDQRMEEKGAPIGFIEEVGGYVWADKIRKEIPEEGAEHSLDAARYLIHTLDRPKSPFAFRII